MDKQFLRFFDFLAFCLSEDRAIPEGIELLDWRAMYDFARRQSVVGVVFHGMQRLPADRVKVPREVLMLFMATAAQIRQRNVVMYRQSALVSERLLQDGFRNCILKGQGNALMYPDPYIRMSGDVDVWVEGRRKDIMAYARKHVPDAEARCYHVDFPVIRDVSIELHFVPSVANNWVYRHRMERFFERMRDLQCSNLVELPDGLGRMPVPTLEFNLVYQLSHMMHHFFDEGIGLRQMMDYYFLIGHRGRREDGGRREEGGRRGEDEHREEEEHRGIGEGEGEELQKTLQWLGLRKFAGAVMYVMREVFGLEEGYMIVPADEWRGRTLLEEILRGGNFGQHSGLTEHGMAAKYFLKIRRNMGFVRQYPAEALCEPLFRTWHFFWRMRNR